MAFDRSEVERIRRDNPIADVIARYVKLTKDGDEYRGLCPFHKEQTPSFSVVPGRGFYHCFGCGAHGDVIDFIGDKLNKSFADAIQILGGKLAAPSTPATMERPSLKPTPYAALDYRTPPESALPRAKEPLRCWNPKRNQWTTYQPSMVFAYRTFAGILQAVVVRIDLGNGKKLTPLLRYVALNGALTWCHATLDAPRPLYGLELLTPGAPGTLPVLLVEGEKAADAARRLAGTSHVALTWQGGGKSIHKADFSPLKGRRVIVWGDADKEGERTAEGWEASTGAWRDGLCDLALKAGATTLDYIPWDRTRPEGWDAADAEGEGWDGPTTARWVASKCKPWQSPGARRGAAGPAVGQGIPDGVPSTHSGSPIGPGLDGVAETDTVEPFRHLGHDQGIYYYQPRGTQQIVMLPRAQHTAANLLALAPLQHWDHHFGGKRGWSLEAAINAMFRRSEAVGIFDPDRLRGRGAWMDGDKPAVHLGDQVHIGGEVLRPIDVPGHFIYQRAKPLPIEIGEPLTSSQAQDLVYVCDGLNWENPLSGTLFAGWHVVALVSGALTWRPHGWLSGPTSAGKSTAKEISRRALGDMLLMRDGTTTEAHLRQKLNSDALAVFIEEMEGNDKAASIKVARNLELIRVSSEGGDIGKGGKDGTPISYKTRSCFMLASIHPALTFYADETRITRLKLKRDTSPGAADRFAQLDKDIRNKLPDGFAERLLGRVIKYLPVLLRNIETFRDAAAEALHARRTSLQLGTLLAGAYLLNSPRLITREKAVAWIKSHKWEDHAPDLDQAQDERQLLAHIATSRHRLTTTSNFNQDFTVGELILAACGKASLPLLDAGITAELGRMGIRVYPQHEPAMFVVANNAPHLQRLLEGKPWVHNWGDSLKALPGAKPTNKIYFSPGLEQRGTAIPVSTLQETPQPKEEPPNGNESEPRDL